MKKFHNLNIIIVGVIVLFIDRITKIILSSIMNLGDSILLIKNVLHFTLVQNRGAGFGILQGQRIFFIIFSFIILGVIIYKWKKIPQIINITIPLGLILGGLTGNLFDRIFFGYVVDFIDFRIWPVFNVADSCITIGVVWLVIYLWNK